MSLWAGLLLGATVILIIYLSWRRNISANTSADDNQVTDTAVSSDTPTPSLALGVKAYMTGDHKRAEPILRHHAEAGTLKAQQLMAKMYYSGHGVQHDMTLYQYWLEQAAAQGDRAAKARIKAIKKAADDKL